MISRPLLRFHKVSKFRAPIFRGPPAPRLGRRRPPRSRRSASRRWSFSSPRRTSPSHPPRRANRTSNIPEHGCASVQAGVVRRNHRSMPRNPVSPRGEVTYKCSTVDRQTDRRKLLEVDLSSSNHKAPTYASVCARTTGTAGTAGQSGFGKSCKSELAARCAFCDAAVMPPARNTRLKLVDTVTPWVTPLRLP